MFWRLIVGSIAFGVPVKFWVLMWLLISGDFQEETPSVVLGLRLDLDASSWKKKENILRSQLLSKYVAGQRR